MRLLLVTLATALLGSVATTECTAAPAQGDTLVRQEVGVGDRVAVTYFHRTFRCEMCLAFEAYSEEALRTSFPDELSEGRLVWSVLNLDDEENARYEDEYGLTELSLVAAVESDGKVVDWKNLADIWGLVNDKQAFLDYVSFEVGKSLQELTAYERAQRDSANSLPVHGEFVPEPDGGGLDAGAKGR